MDDFPKELTDFSSADAFDLATMGFGMEDEMENGTEDDTPHINPLHDPDSLDFYLWMEEEVDKEARRRAAKNNK